MSYRLHISTIIRRKTQRSLKTYKERDFMNMSILVPPIIGAVIGYITNDIAIKMLFHPRKPVYIGKWQLPFTPGLIPKEKNRVARSIGKVVSTQLLNSDTLINVLTSEEMTTKLRIGLEKLVDDNRTNRDTLNDLLYRMAPAEMVDNAVDKVKRNLSDLICSKLTSMKFGERVSAFLLQKINQTVNDHTRGFVFNLFDETMVRAVSGNIGELIDKAISDHSEEIVTDLVDSEGDALLQMRICDIIDKYQEKIPDLINFIIRAYVHLIRNNLEQILNGINIGKIVEDRIASFDVIQLEQMIFGIMKKELSAIVYLGALLGFLMGWLNLLIGNLI